MLGDSEGARGEGGCQQSLVTPHDTYKQPNHTATQALSSLFVSDLKSTKKQRFVENFSQ